jgi:molybdate transport system substrate-binding protein
MLKRAICAITLALVFCATLVCTGFTAEKKLEILCAPAMRAAIEEMRIAFKKSTGVSTQISYEGSGALLAQLRLSPHGDLFIPADRFYTDEAVKTGLAESPRIFAYLVPVIIVQKGNEFKIRKLSDMMKPGLRIGLEDERAGAIGKVTAEVLKKNRIKVDKMNVVYWASKVDELANAIKLKSIDASIIWKPVAIQYPEDISIIEIPGKQNVVAPVSAGIVKSSTNKATAKKFLNYLTSKAGKAILAKYHYPTTDPSKK